jgi:hypothetical protein
MVDVNKYFNTYTARTKLVSPSHTAAGNYPKNSNLIDYQLKISEFARGRQQ